MRALLLAGLVVAAAFALPTASACCHVLYYREDVGPCYAEWHGDGLRLRSDSAEINCFGQTLVWVGPLDPLP